MPPLPTVKPRQVIRALERAGFEIDHPVLIEEVEQLLKEG